MATMVPRRDLLKVVKVHQVEKDAIIVCYSNIIQVVTLQGNPKQHKKLVSQLNFDFNVDSIGKSEPLALVTKVFSNNFFLFFQCVCQTAF